MLDASSSPLPRQQSKRIFLRPPAPTTRFLLSDLDSSDILHLSTPDSLLLNSLPSHLYYNYTMDATTQAQPLADRSTNTHLANANADKTDLKAADLSSMEYHRQVLQGKVESGDK